MQNEFLSSLFRRAMVLVATGAVIGVSVVTVQTASGWRAAAAPLDTAPVSMNAISTDMEAEAARTTVLTGQVDDVASQLGQLQGALMTANDSISGDADAVGALQKKIDDAKTKYDKLQKQLKTAQTRLSQLNAAASKQAALNARSKKTSSSGSSGTSATQPREGRDDDD
jgi:septal ring factor EnvC (AmiA/AmiB activator)